MSRHWENESFERIVGRWWLWDKPIFSLRWENILGVISSERSRSKNNKKRCTTSQQSTLHKKDSEFYWKCFYGKPSCELGNIFCLHSSRTHQCLVCPRIGCFDPKQSNPSNWQQSTLLGKKHLTMQLYYYPNCVIVGDCIDSVFDAPTSRAFKWITRRTRQHPSIQQSTTVIITTQFSLFQCSVLRHTIYSYSIPLCDAIDLTHLDPKWWNSCSRKSTSSPPPLEEAPQHHWSPLEP